MNTVKLPINIDAWQWSRMQDQARRLEGFFPVSEINGLQDLVDVAQSKVSLNAHFYRDEQGYSLLIGQLKAELWVQCQRCLELMPLTLELDLNLTLIETEQAARTLPEDREPLVLPTDERLSVPRLLSEEILLALPIVPKHEDPNCFSYLANYFVPESEVDDVKPSPFSLLENLKA